MSGCLITPTTLVKTSDVSDASTAKAEDHLGTKTLLAKYRLKASFPTRGLPYILVIALLTSNTWVLFRKVP